MAVFAIGSVARRTGLSTDTIRAWERRYGLVIPVRDGGGARFYSESEVSRLALARQATELGHPIRYVATLETSAIASLVQATPPPPPAHGAEVSEAIVVAALLDALLNDDAERLKRTMISAAAVMAPIDLTLRVLVPLLTEVGSRWERGALPIWQEHLLSVLISSTVRSLERTAIDEDAWGILFATPPLELHSFGTAFASMIAASRGFRAYNLGVSLPIEQVVAAARHLKVGCVAIGISYIDERSAELAEYFKKLERALPEDIAIWVGGAASAQMLELAGGGRLRAVSSLEEFAAAIERQSVRVG